MTSSSTTAPESGLQPRSTARAVRRGWRECGFLCHLGRGWAVAIYLIAVAAAHHLALWLRFDGSVPAAYAAAEGQVVGPLLVVYGGVFVAAGLHRRRWRNASIWELRDLVAAAGISAIVFYVFVRSWMQISGVPASVFIFGAVLSVCVFGGLRVARRLAGEGHLTKNHLRVLIVGAGDAGELIARDLRKRGHQPIGFIDDDAAKKGQSVQGVKVLGSSDDLPRAVAALVPDQVLIAMPSAGPATLRRFISALAHLKVPITTLPPLREIVDGRVAASDVRRIEVRDLLPRLPVHLDSARARSLIEGGRVLITGAGGSIGSELCRQVARFDPDRLILYERYENNLYAVLNTLPGGFRVKAVLGDVTDRRRLHAVLGAHRPDIIFHAAAHKHVPLMELNPCEAVKNNVVGTRMVAEAAARFGVERFILISTDKAVNPTSLMGATKRAAELVVQSLATDGGLEAAIVRFGNVLGSNGSVIPRWLEQIAAGGPVTVTHPDVRRYFMLIHEAVELILQAAAVARGGEIFALEMGEQINLLKMARDLIRMSGFIPDEEIAIEIVGLRPGEKLSEELVGLDEQMECSPVEKVLRLNAPPPSDSERLLREIAVLGALAQRGDTVAAVDLLRQIVPTFEPGPLLTRATVVQTRRKDMPARSVPTTRRSHGGPREMPDIAANKPPRARAPSRRTVRDVVAIAQIPVAPAPAPAGRASTSGGAGRALESARGRLNGDGGFGHSHESAIDARTSVMPMDPQAHCGRGPSGQGEHGGSLDRGPSEPG